VFDVYARIGLGQTQYGKRILVSGSTLALSVLVILSSQAIACANMTDKNFRLDQSPGSQNNSNAPRSIAVRTIAKGVRSGVRESLQTVARNNAEWQALWQKHATAQSNPTPPPSIDFKNEIVAAVFLGDKPTGGYAIEIVGAEKTDGPLMISYSEKSPRPGSMQTQAFTQPFHIVRIIANDAEKVVFRRLP